MYKLKTVYNDGCKINNYRDSLKYFNNIRTLDRECVVCLHLNTTHKVIAKEIVSIGSLNQSVVHPRELFKGAILNSASAIIIAHNHPSGEVEPSENDKEITKNLIAAGKILGIEVIDHIIVARVGCYSFKQHENIE